MDRFAGLSTRSFAVQIADNSALGEHRAGYNGVASLVPAASGRNLFVPAYAGLNYEFISLTHLPPYAESHGGFKFEPRAEPMRIDSADEPEVVLVQDETSHAHVAARIAFRVEEPHYLHQRVELTFCRYFHDPGHPYCFRGLFASYLNAPEDRHVYLKMDEDFHRPLANWAGLTKADHAAPTMQVRPLPADRQITPAEHLEAMRSQPPMSADEMSDLPAAELSPTACPKALDGPLAFYYGLPDPSLLFLMMFKQPERFRLAYSPCGGGKQPAWNPAWDYVLYLESFPVNTPCVWDLCLAVKDYRGRADVLEEVNRYRAR